MDPNLTFLDILVKSIKSAASFKPEEEIAPCAILWPDGEREWEPIISRLREHLPVLTLGEYDPNTLTGPPAWLRCMLAQSLPNRLAPNVIPVLYLPGVNSIELCNLHQRPNHLGSIIDILFRGALWVNGDCQDWHIHEYFQSTDFGLGVEIRDDDYTIKAMRRVLPALCDLKIEKLNENEPWKARDFEDLVSDITKMIAMGESADMEFKSTARWSVRDGIKYVEMEKVILNTVAGFLNSTHGGTLLIGVEDNGNSCGIELDYQAFKNEKDHNLDAYERWLMGLLFNMYGHEFTQNIHVTFHYVDEKTVCKIVADPAPKPVFVTIRNMHGQEEDIFYLRVGNATNSLRTRDFLSYYQTRWMR